MHFGGEKLTNNYLMHWAWENQEKDNVWKHKGERVPTKVRMYTWTMDTRQKSAPTSADFALVLNLWSNTSRSNWEHEDSIRIYA